MSRPLGDERAGSAPRPFSDGRDADCLGLVGFFPRPGLGRRGWDEPGVILLRWPGAAVGSRGWRIQQEGTWI